MTALVSAPGETGHDTPSPDPRTNVGFVMEQALGHITHHKNLARWVENDAGIGATWLPIPTQANDRWERLPGVRDNWSLKASLRARDALRNAGKTQTFDALFLHTQTVSLFALDWMRRVPTVISLDATPLNYDRVGVEYGHQAAKEGWLERQKFLWNLRAFEAATSLTTWCKWAKNSLVTDYGVAASKITVIPPGVDMAKWDFGANRRSKPTGERMRLLFVGGDFGRKGGPALLKAFRASLYRDCTLDVVTQDADAIRDMQGVEGVRAYAGLTANSKELCDLYANADLFVFPTRGDCMPLAVMEAMAAGLPVIATDVGALREEVEEGRNGLIVAPGNVEAISEAVQALIADPARRERMGRASREIAEQRFDACRNYNAILALIKTTANTAQHS